MLNTGRWSGRGRRFPTHGCPISKTPVWEVVKHRVVLNQPIVPKDDGIRLPLHSDLRRNARLAQVTTAQSNLLVFSTCMYLIKC